MKLIAQRVGLLTVSIASSVGLEGAFFLAGTALLAVGASFVTPAGPWLVVGGMFVLASIALVVPGRR